MSIVPFPATRDTDESRARAVRLFTFLRAVTELRSKPICDLERYPEVLWLSQIPEEPECSTLWRSGPVAETDGWLRVRKPAVQTRPQPPPLLDAWLSPEDLDNSSLDFPSLASRDPDESSDSGSQDTQSEPPLEVSEAHSRYVEQRWWPWALKDRRMQPILDVYKRLFTIYQRQQQLGEQYEVMLGLGYLTWEPQASNPPAIRRHLLVANCSLEFDPDRAVISVGPGGDGAQLTVEQEMLDPEYRVTGAALDQVNRLLEADDALGNEETIPRALTTWVNAASPTGSFRDGLGPQAECDVNPVVSLAPAIILRRRTERSLLAMLDGIVENLQEGGAIPPGVRGLVEIEDDQAQEGETSSLLPDGNIYFPLDANREQIDIVRKLSAHQGVLVQGPPGTGKSHTIANLVAHLLASGQRVLVTSQAPRALEVLRALLPQEIAALAVLLLGADSKSIQSMEDSVQGISDRFQSWDDDAAAAEIARLEVRRDSVRRHEAEVRGQLRDSRRTETEPVGPLAGGYQGTPQAIAERLGAEAEEFQWLSGYQASGDPPLSNREAFELLGVLRAIPELRSEADGERLVDPNQLPSPDLFRQRIQAESRASENARRSAAALQAPLSTGLARIDPALLKAAGRAVEELVKGLERLQPAEADWLRMPWADLLRGADGLWISLRDDTQRALTTIGTTQEVLTNRLVTGIEGPERESVRAHAQALRAHLKNGHGTGFSLIRPRPLREAIRAMSAIRVEGQPVNQVASVETLLTWVNAWDQLDELDGRWKMINPAPEGSVSVRLAHYRDSLRRLSDILDLRPMRERAAKAVENIPTLAAARWEQLPAIGASLALLMAEGHRRQAVAAALPVQETLTRLREVAARPRSHLCVGALWQAVEARDPDAYDRGYPELKLIDARQRQAERAVQLLDRLAGPLPQIADELLATAPMPDWDSRLHQFEAAWYWVCADSWLRHAPAPDVQQKWLRELEDLHRESMAITRDLAAAKAWQHCLRRLTPAHRQHLQAWSQAMRRVGRGTGKYAASHRANARDHMEECRDAIPAWIMPIYRVAETMRPGVDSFDVVIVDEASQSGPDALFLNYLARRVVVVGDDMQISPSQVGLDLAQVDFLARQYLTDIPHRDALSFRNSFFDQAKIRFGARVALREHFRCMPEIIQFSNDLCYRTEPLIPVRQFGAGRLSPVVIARPIKAGYLAAGHTNQNPAEAHAVVDAIVECCAAPAYAGKSMGVISLVGETQAKLIETELAQRLGPEEMERRMLTCGDAYAFQGAERDVVFLSMVSAVDETRRMASLTGEKDRQRFNVAASRARDQMWLFHSATLGDFHTAEDVRHKLLAYCQKPHVEPTAAVDGEGIGDWERRARIRAVGERPPSPFDSWFEVDVFLRLVRRGYRLIPQYRLAGYRVDLMVEGLHGRIAVECDGDYWHGPEQHDADMARQRELERCGLRFIRISGFNFYLDRDGTIADVVDELRRQHVHPDGEVDDLGMSGNAPTTAGIEVRPIPVVPSPDEPTRRSAGPTSPGAVPRSDALVGPTPKDLVDRATHSPPEEISPPVPLANEPDAQPTATVLAAVPSDPPAESARIPEMSQASDRAPSEGPSVEAPARRFAFDPGSGKVGQTEGRRVPPPSASPDRVAAALVEMLGDEGPVVTEVLFRHYVRASGGHKVGTQIRDDLLRALARAAAAGHVIVRDELGEEDRLRAVVRLPSTPEVVVRDRTPEASIREIPPSELASVMRSLRGDYQGGAFGEALYRRVLRKYHMVRLTEDARRYLEEIAKYYL
ncbi:MAG: AAA domain-containing protein [Candidatus Dormibacteria bacterium]